jgi:hypothetical protein
MLMSALRASALSAAFIGGRFGRSWPVRARRGEARPNAVRSGALWPSKGYRRWHGGSSLPAILMDGSGNARSGLARRGRAWRGEIWRGEDGYGQATADDLSTEPFGALCWVLLNPVLAWRAEAWCSGAGHGAARHGRAGQGNTGSRHQPAAPLDCSRTGPSDVLRVSPLRSANRQTRSYQSR